MGIAAKARGSGEVARSVRPAYGRSMEHSRNPAAGWRPLLEGEAAAQAEAAIADIATVLLEPPPEREGDGAEDEERVRRADDASLSGGLAGEGLFLCYLGQARGDAATEEVGTSRIDAAIDLLVSQPMGAGLYSGFSGIAWVVAHLAPPDDEVEEDANDDIDELLLDHVQSSPWLGDYDLVSGLVGLGVYALERWPRERARGLLEGLVARLDELAEPGEGGLTWHTAPELLPEWQRKAAPEGYYNLGLAHGVAGVVGLLGAAAGLGALSPRGRELLEGAVGWLLERRQPAPADARWDSWYRPGVDAQPARSAWCYGDPGVAAAVHLAGVGAGRDDWRRAAREALVGVAERPVDRCGVRDAGLCHGAAGLAHVLNRAYQATGDATIGDAARAWFGRLFEMRFSQPGVAGFPSYYPTSSGEPRWIDDAGLLTGATGVGLALLAATSDQRPAWDRFMLLS